MDWIEAYTYILTLTELVYDLLQAMIKLINQMDWVEACIYIDIDRHGI